MSPASGAPAIGASSSRSLNGAFFFSCAVVIAAYGWIVFGTVWEPDVTSSATQPYNLQAEGFRRGHTNLPIPMPAGLLALEDPYDPAQNSTYRTSSAGNVGLHDLSLKDGKLYLYFGPTPAVVLFLPWLLLTGRAFPEELAVLLFCSVGFLAGVWLLHRLTRRFLRASPTVMGGGVLALGFASGLPTWLLRPAVYEVAISCGCAFVFLALVFIQQAIDSRRGGEKWVALASLALGFAVAARPTLLFGTPILLIPLVARGRWSQATFPIKGLAAAIVPIAAVGILVLVYNATRFGNPAEFGQGYQLAGVNVHRRPILFSPAFVMFNLRLYFWEPVRWTFTSVLPAGINMPYPPAGYFGAENPFGILTSIPFVALATVLPFLRKAKGVRDVGAEWFQSCLWLVFFSAAMVLCTFGGACSRYEIEFLPALVLLAAWGFLALDEKLAEAGSARFVVRGFCGLLLAYSAAVGLLVGASAVSPHVSIRNRDLLALLEAGKKEQAVSGFETLARHYPTNAASHANLGTAYFESGRLQDAVVSYRRALNTDPTLVEVYNNLGVTLDQLGAVTDARRHFKRALELNPNYRDAAMNLARLEQKVAPGPQK